MVVNILRGEDLHAHLYMNRKSMPLWVDFAAPPYSHNDNEVDEGDPTDEIAAQAAIRAACDHKIELAGEQCLTDNAK